MIFAPYSFPLYYELKLVGLVWLMAPQTRGAQLIYDKFINPFLTQHAAKFDPIFATTKLVSHSLLNVLLTYGLTTVTECRVTDCELYCRL